jgi:NAD(P) transhydrogenase subunit beta
MDPTKYQVTDFALDIGLLVAAASLILGLKLMSHPKTAQRGNLVAALGMALGAGLTLTNPGFVQNDYLLIGAAIALGSVIGVVTARTVKMTAMPQMVAIFNGLGGAASLLVAAAELYKVLWAGNTPESLFLVTGGLSMIIGAVTLTGSLIAFAKLQEVMTTSPILFPGLRLLAIGMGALCLVTLVYLAAQPEMDGQRMLISWWVGLGVAALLLGILLVIPIGGADMPVVISLLNSYSGLAACAAGFVVKSNVLIVSGSLVGAAGIILTNIMCKAMNRSLANVMFSAFGAQQAATAGDGDDKPMKEFQPLDAAVLLSNANQVIVVPGYGLAVSQAQQAIRELAEELDKAGIHVKYAIHPVAGRMPGHMNVLLAEANVSYEALYDLDDINGDFETTDVCIVIGANDVTNPSARDDKQSPLYGMPVFNCDKAQTVIVLKRGRGKGFAGVQNPLFTNDNTGLVFGDAKGSLVKILNEVKQL